MSYYTLNTVQRLPISIDEAWDYFSTPVNLNDLTPPDMHLQILDAHPPAKMFAGQIITYTVRPMFNIPFYWMTEITHAVSHEYFVDEQRYGPFALWHHHHKFIVIPGGVEMHDTVHYKMPFWILGQFIHSILIRKRVQQIFEYRHQVLEAKFGKM